MKKEIEEVIRKHLPEATAGEMRKFMEEAEETAKELKKSQKAIKNLEAHADSDHQKISDLETQLQEKQEQIHKLTLQLERCDDCKAKYSEINFKFAACYEREAAAHTRVEDMKELAALVFKSPTFKKTHFKNRSIPVFDNNGCQYTGTENENSETTIED